MISARNKALIRKKFGPEQRYFAALGDGNGNVVVPGYNFLHYARVQGVVLKIWNRFCDPIHDLEVEIEYSGNQIVVTGLRSRSYALIDHISLAGKHAPSHLPDGPDPVYLYLLQLLDFKIIPDGMSIVIYRGRMLAEQWKAPVRASGWNLTAYRPASGACWLLVYVSLSGGFGVIASETADTLALLTPALIPTPPFGTWALAGIRLYANQTAIHPLNDIYELRWSATPFNAASGASSATIEAGAITARSQYIVVNGEGETDDDLETIDGGAHGSQIVIRAAAGIEITVKHGTGNIATTSGEDFSLVGAIALSMIYDTVTETWYTTGGGGGGGGEGSGAYSTIIGDGIESEFTITHDLTAPVVVQLWDLTGTYPVLATTDADLIEVLNDNAIVLTFSDPPDEDSYRVVVLKSGGVGGTITEKQQQTLYTFEGELEVVDNPLRIFNSTEDTFSIEKVHINVPIGSEPTGAAIIVDVNVDGVTIFTNQAHRPSILATEDEGETSDIDEPNWAPGSYLTVAVDQIGSTLPGDNLVVAIIYRRS